MIFRIKKETYSSYIHIVLKRLALTPHPTLSKAAEIRLHHAIKTTIRFTQRKTQRKWEKADSLNELAKTLPPAVWEVKAECKWT